MKKPQTNVQFVRDIMEFSKGGTLAQAIVMTAIEKYCQMVVGDKDNILAQMKGGMINGEAWVATCEEILTKVNEHFAKSSSGLQGTEKAAKSA